MQGGNASADENRGPAIVCGHMRIISGEFKGKKLASLKGNATRPTSDRVREAVFNILSADVKNAAVLDLFAGTGALGLEALSRGASNAVFIDISASAVNIIQKNAAACKIENRARIMRWDIAKNLNCLQATFLPFDLVFMDPPYNQNFMTSALKNLIAAKVLKNSARIIIEHAAAETIPQDIATLHLTDQRIYGKTLVSFLSVVLQEKF